MPTPNPAEATPVWSHDPRTGEPRARVAVESGPDAVDRTVRAAHAALPALADRPRRIALLRAAADLLELRAPELVAAADAETALGTVRLGGEVARAAGQLRAFAQVVAEGGYLGVTLDQVPQGPLLRRWKVPLGVVGVFAASNFPLAFSVPGGDTASALAAGCPVVVKAHPDHPETAELAAALLREAAGSVGLPPEVVGLLHGFAAGPELVRHPLLTGVGFTGSVRGGRALHDLAAGRPVPIPFHGELGSLNPVLVTERAAAERAAELAAGLAGSATLGMGQFCTKPGLVLVPEGPAGDRLEHGLAEALRAVVPGVLLDGRIRAAYLAGFAERAGLPGVRVPVAAAPSAGDPRAVRAGCLSVPAELAVGALLEECFGPVTVLARYRTAGEALDLLARLGGNLTATLHTGAAEAAGGDGTDGEAARWLAALTPLAGRVVFGGWPTGVAVVPAMQHGGPYPASTSAASSVGASAIERWLRPVAYQDVPEHLLAPELHLANPLGVPRRVDGRLELPGA